MSVPAKSAAAVALLMTRKILILSLIYMMCWISPAQKKRTPAIHTENSIKKFNSLDTAMVLIPGGYFNMGSADGKDDEKPVHRVYVSDFYMDKYEVTVAQFIQFIDATGYRTDAENGDGSYIWTGSKWEKKSGINWRQDEEGNPRTQTNYPVVHVSWNDAVAYARWTGKRLPTEAELEYAARYDGRGYKYSWGNGEPSGKRGGNIGDESAKRKFSSWTIWNGYDDGFIYAAPVGSFDPNEFGLYDMTGNVWEWSADWYDKDYYKNSPERNPRGPLTGTTRVLRGSSWSTDPSDVRLTSRYSHVDPSYRRSNYGFRCVKDVR